MTAMNDHDKLRASAQALCDKLELVHNDHRYHGVWALAQAHGANYTGPTYTEELAAVKAALAALGGKGEARDREADRARFPDADFNRWLDEAISDCGHIVWHQIVSIEDAWAAWDSRPYYAKERHPLADAPEDELFATQPEARGDVVCCVCEELVEKIGQGYVPRGHGVYSKPGEQPEAQNEAVAWLRDIDGTGSLHPAAAGDPGAFPVYTAAPKPAEGVTDAMVEAACARIYIGWEVPGYYSESRMSDMRQTVRAALAAAQQQEKKS